MATRWFPGVTDSSDVAARWSDFRRAYEQQRFADALAQLRAFPDESRGIFQAVAHEADLLGKLGDHEGEIKLLRQLTEQHPEIASLWVSIAHAQRTLGRTDEAVATLRHAIAIDPSYGKPWWLLSDLKRFRFDDDDIATMEHMINGDLASADRLSVHFALAKAREDRGEAQDAFKHLAAGNRIRATTIDSRTFRHPQLDRLIALFSRDFVDTGRWVRRLARRLHRRNAALGIDSDRTDSCQSSAD